MEVSDEKSVAVKNLTEIGDMGSNEEDEGSALMQKTKIHVRRRVHKFSDSESESDKENKAGNPSCTITACDDKNLSSDDEGSIDGEKFTKNHTSRIRHLSNSSSDDESENETPLKNEQQIRMANKNSKLKEKFRSLITSRGKVTDGEAGGIQEHGLMDEVSDMNNSDSSNSYDEEKSIEKLKQKIKENTKTLKTTIYDPDTSDEETMGKQVKGNKNTVKSSKPIRLSAKQAMDNMHKIKSESNRMLREKEVSLPYHRPKAFTLKDILNRRKPALSNDGKALPIKMNNEQLKQYISLLEERQKEMIELCKSDSEDEAEEAKNAKSETIVESTEVQNVKTIADADLLEVSAKNEDKSEKCESSNTSTDFISYDETMNKVQNASVKYTDEDKNVVQDNNVTSVNNKSEEEMNLVYNDSIEEINNKESTETFHVEEVDKPTQNNEEHSQSHLVKPNECTVIGSQFISLHFDSEKIDTNSEINDLYVQDHEKSIVNENKTHADFSDDDLIMDEDIDKLIENAEILKDDITAKQYSDSPMSIKDLEPFKMKPKLLGAPGMVIDLDGTDPIAPNKTGVELLKERFIYFATIKTPEELEREREKRIKPGMQHLRLKHELEEQIAEQRSLEWAKRLENEKKQQHELNAIRGDESDIEDDIDKIEAKLAESNDVEEDDSSESEEELEENDCDMKEKTKKRNPLVDDEAEVSENEDVGCEKNQDIEDDDDDETSEDSSSESEEETAMPRKGRILKAFEDSDDENLEEKNTDMNTDADIVEKGAEKCEESNKKITGNSQDDEIQLAQMQTSFSEDLFTSQESETLPANTITEQIQEQALTTQPEIISQFSILDSNSNATKTNLEEGEKVPDSIEVICETQPNDDTNFAAIVGMCSGSFSQSLITTHQNKTADSQTQEFGDDVLALCTGKFYDNQFISQNGEQNDSLPISCNINDVQNSIEDNLNKDTVAVDETVKDEEGCALKSIMDELDGPDSEAPKAKYFTGNTDLKNNVNTQVKKRLIIDSDEGVDDDGTIPVEKRKKKLRKRKPKQRALQISDDEDDEISEQEDIYDSEAEDDAERLVEYDSEENEVPVIPRDIKKKKRKVADFFEQEAEMTSEDEWVGSGDEDERGLDRMEREEGDDDTFHQGKLQAELGQIHMRDVLDQDKREVRIIQELLFEDGDLGDGHRQRKFRWKNADGDEEIGTMPGEVSNTQEEEFESEEMWRKQRHERETFLRQMHQKHSDNSPNVTVNRMSIIKANLNAKTAQDSIIDINISTSDNAPPLLEKKTSKDLPSPKKSYTMFQQSFHGSILSRGKGTLARLAALATPLAGDDDVKNVGSKKKNFVFATIQDNEIDEPKKTKRKAEADAGTPRLVKKMRTEDKQKHPASSLLDYLKV